MSSIIFISFIILLLMGVPIAFILGLSPILGILFSGKTVWLLAVPQRLFTGLDQFTLLAIPFYILAGNLMNACGITKRLIKFFQLILGHVHGALAQVNIVASMFFAGISGTATADTAALGSVLIPAMIQDGYTPGFSTAVTVASSMIGPIIPPSMLMIMYSVMADTSIAEMFLAGIVPGILLGAGQMILVYYYSRKNNFPTLEKRATTKEIAIGFRDAILALIMPLIILGGILLGVFTATESAAVAVVYAFIIGYFVYGELNLSNLPSIFLKSAVTSAAVMLIAGTGQVFAWLMAAEMIPQKAMGLLMTVTSNPIILMFLINVFLLFIGTFMETLASLIILTPILLPIVTQMGIDPVHFGIVMTLNLTIGLMTPPLGVCLFIASSITKLSIERLIKDIWPFLLVNISILFLITYFPKLVLFLPNLIK